MIAVEETALELTKGLPTGPAPNFRSYFPSTGGWFELQSSDQVADQRVGILAPLGNINQQMIAARLEFLLYGCGSRPWTAVCPKNEH